MNKASKGNWFFFILMIFMPIASIAIGVFYMLFFEFDLLAYSIITDIFIFILPITIYFVFFNSNYKITIPFKKISVRNILYILLISILLSPILNFLGYLSSALPTGDSLDNYLFELLKDTNMFSIFIVIVILPCIFEELIMRGIILSNYKFISVKKMAIMNGLMFGLFHMNLGQFFYAVIAGIVFSLIVYYTGSIFSSMISHFVINASSMIALAFSKEEFIKQSQTEMFFSMSDLIFSFLFALISLILLIKVMKKFINYNQINNEIIETNVELNRYNVTTNVFDLPIILAIGFAVIYIRVSTILV